MPRVALSDEERVTLEALVAHPPNSVVSRCAQALLWLHAGETVAEVARRLRVHRATIYDWLQRCQRYSATDITAWLKHSPHRGRLHLLVVLSDAEQQTLAHLVAHATEAMVVRRAQALLWLSTGEKVVDVAIRLRVYCSTLSAWMRRFRHSSFADFLVWLTGRPPPGRPQALVILSEQERQALEALVAHPRAAAVGRRAQALLWLNSGTKVPEVMLRLGVSRCAIYNWVQSFQETQTADVGQRLAALPSPEHARSVYARLELLLRAVIDRDPHEVGYQATVWTATLVRQYLWHEHGITVSGQRLHHVMRRLERQRPGTRERQHRQTR